MRRIFILMLTGGLMVALNMPVWAGLVFSAPTVGRSSLRYLEIGASGTMRVIYTNNTGGSVNVDAVTLFMDFESSLIDSISVSNPNPANFNVEQNDVVGGGIRFQLRTVPPGQSPRTVAAGASVDLAIISFHIAQTAANAEPPRAASYVIRFTTTDRTNNVQVAASGTNVTGTIVDPVDAAATALHLESSQLPTFAGLASATDATTGNTINLDWAVSETGAGDRRVNAETLYPAGGTQLRYRIFEATSDTIGSQILGPDENRTTYTRTGLNDNTPYWYAVRGQDNCTATHNVDPNTVTRRVVPHDYTPPATPTHIPQRSTDQAIHFQVTIPGGDTGGVVVIRKPGTAAPNFAPIQAVVDEDGTTPPAVGAPVPGDADAAVVYSGGTPGSTITINDSPLTNGAPYTYMVRAYDPINGTPHQQGNNWSSADTFTLYPGEPPPGVANLVAGGSGSGRISVRWTNPTVDYYGGAKVLITTDVTKWGATMAYDSDTRDPDNVKLAVDKVVADPKPETEEVVIDNIGGTPLADGTVYYVGVFSYNKTTDPAARTPSGGSYAGTWPGGGGGGPVTYTFTKAASGLGLSSFAVLQDTPLSVTLALEGGPAGTPVAATTVADFVNALGGPSNVATIGWLEGDRMVGYYVTSDGFTATEGSGLAAATTVNMSRGRAYQISVLKTMDVTISGR